MRIPEILIFENDDFIVLNKPSGLLSIPDRQGKENSLRMMLQGEYADGDDPAGRRGIFTIHRLDKGTSGLIVFGKSQTAHQFLSQQFEDRQTEKIYLGLVIGSPGNKRGTIDSPIMEHPIKKGLMVINRKGRESLTDYEVLRDFRIYSWVQFCILTGRTHQIRVHMKDIGHPVVCDELYGDGKPVFISTIKHNFKLSKNAEEERPILKRLALHAYRLKFMGPDHRNYEFEAPIPKDLKATLQQLVKTEPPEV